MEVRPVQPHERETLEELGALLAYARQEAGLTQRQLALASGFTLRHLQYLEVGERRTRLSTLGRMAGVLATQFEMGESELLDAFVEAAGDSLAPESDYADKVEARRQRRARRASLEELMTDRLGRVARRRSAPEAKRRAAWVTHWAMRRNAGLPGL
jgi:transcriptional regulator with XRE-family HTH domain